MLGKKVNVLYLSYTGLLEPLGQSQILNYLELLSAQHIINLITFEKSADLEDQDELERLRDACAEAGIRWIPLVYHKSPRLVATVYDLWQCIRKSLRIIKKEQVQLIHCRAYIPAFAGMLLKKLTRTPFIFDMRAFWPEEMVSAGRIKKDSLQYKGIKKLEQRALESADQVITLTRTSAEYLHRQNSSLTQKMETIPTCVDLDHFKPAEPSTGNTRPFTLGVVGTVTGWFQFDRVLSFFKAIQQVRDNARLKIYSRDDEQWILDKAREQGVEGRAISISQVPFREVPDRMQQMNAGIFFYKPYLSELARSPTKMGEFLACGVPVVANEGIGDVGHIIEQYNVGVLLDNEGSKSSRQAAEELLELLRDPELKDRCRIAAEEWFSIAKGVEKYNEIYERLA